MRKTYFAADGTYGDAEGLVIVDTTDWTDDEWADIEYSLDSERVAIALSYSSESPDQDPLPGLE